MRRLFTPTVLRVGMLSLGLAGLAAGVTALSASGDFEARIRPTQGPLQTTPAGRLEAPVSLVGVIVADEVALAFELPGRIKRVPVRVGQAVDVGVVLAVLDPRDAQEELRMAEAQLSAARAESDRARLDLSRAGAELSRAQKLTAHVSKAEIEDALFRRREAEIRLRAARAKHEEFAARTRKLSFQLEETELKAPFAGQVAAISVPEGERVEASRPVIRLIREGQVKIRFAVPPDVVTRVQPGTKIEAQARTGGAALTAEVDRVWPEVDIGSRSVFVEARAQLPDGAALPLVGTPVEVRVVSMERTDG